MESNNIQSQYQKAILFAAQKHHDALQLLPGTQLPYLVHLSNVAMEILIAAEQTPNFNTGFAVQVALLHDTLEDTSTTSAELELSFGIEVAEAVNALTKNDNLSKDEKMSDSLTRIQSQPKEVWAVKLADRITNLQKPPVHWDSEKKLKYKSEAQIILTALEGANLYLESRLATKIIEYSQYV
jgi:(p)ppGpp synthase/HD superfamily hydrolase